jgi:hypothetical protein
VDERERSEDDAVPQAHVRYALVRGGRAEASVRLDTGEPAPLARKLDNSWAPRVSVRGDRVLVTWIDFLNYDWDVFARISHDSGATFAPQRAVNDTVPEFEALGDTPRALLARGARPFVTWTDWRKTDEASLRPPRRAPPEPTYSWPSRTRAAGRTTCESCGCAGGRSAAGRGASTTWGAAAATPGGLSSPAPAAACSRPGRTSATAHPGSTRPSRGPLGSADPLCYFCRVRA